MKKEVNLEIINRVQSEIINLHKRLSTNEKMTADELEKSNDQIKERILTINKQL